MGVRQNKSVAQNPGGGKNNKYSEHPVHDTPGAFGVDCGVKALFLTRYTEVLAFVSIRGRIDDK